MTYLYLFLFYWSWFGVAYFLGIRTSKKTNYPRNKFKFTVAMFLYGPLVWMISLGSCFVSMLRKTETFKTIEFWLWED